MGDVIDKFSILNLSEVWLLLFYLDLFLKKKKQAKKWQTFENNLQNFYIKKMVFFNDYCSGNKEIIFNI
jgi:hypothetical protein